MNLNQLLQNSLKGRYSTTVAILGLASLLAPIWLPEKYADKVKETAVAVLASGLIVCPDPKKEDPGGN